MYNLLLLIAVTIIMSSTYQYSSGFQSMLGSPTGDQDFWSNIQELESRVQQLERGSRQHPYSSTPGVYERNRHDSASSSGSTVIDSSQVVHHPAELVDSQGKLLLENNLTLTDGTLDSLKKFAKVEVKIAIVGVEMRGPEECTCSLGCNQKCSSRQMTALYAELEKRLQQALQENEVLKQRLETSERLQGNHHSDMPTSVYTQLHCETGDEIPQEDEEELSSSVVEYSETSQAHIEELKTSQKEKTQQFTIKSVVDPRNDKIISFDDAVAEKIIQLERGMYVNTTTGERKTIDTAMKERLIRVASKTTRWTNIPESSVGIMTIQKNITPAGTLLVKEFMDTEKGQMVSKNVAIQRGIVDRQLSTFKDLKSGETINILQAVDKGCVTLEGGVRGAPEMKQCVYRVSGIIDKRSNEVLSFQEALIRGLIMKENGLCKDTSTGKYIYAGFALLSGLMQVDPIEDATHLETLQV